jgi:hypothetical protein
MIGIYKITSPSGKIYIGQAVNIEKRGGSYRRGVNCKNQPRLYASLLKYSFSEHIFEVIEECIVEELNTRERHWQDFYDVLGPKGLNCRLTTTEDRSGYLSQETRQRLSIVKKSFYKSAKGAESRAMQVANTDYAEVARKLRKPVIQYTVRGLLIKEWNSISEAAEHLQIKIPDITTCCRGRQQSAAGFIWRYKTGNVEQEIQVGLVGKELQDKKRMKKVIMQYSLEEEIVTEWPSIREAIRSTGIKTIGDCLQGRQSQAGGFIWKYK